ncbi:porin [Noviherbaspirillum sp.]|uniref:porin n=1 Tax=Noviherbaspirillum sp. TaxID=1926288 RepID=UPI0025FF2FAE|nr:porin [Noviherbaspirillum sp.]
MKSKLLPLAALLALPFGALAQTNVTVYGFIDAGVAMERGAAAGSVTKQATSISGPSRLGFKGVEDLGGGTKAIFNIETGFNVDTGATATPNLFGRTTFVGLTGGFGTVTLGNQFTSLYTTLLLVGDPMRNGYAGQAGNLMNAAAVAGPRAVGGLGIFRANTIKYKTPKINGFDADVAYSFGEVAGDGSKSRSYGLSAGYANGPLVVQASYLNTNNALGTDSSRNSLLAANYNFGVAQAHFAYGVNKGFASVDNTDLLVGVTVPFGTSRIIASYIHKNDKAATANDANQIGLTYAYQLSKRTELYASAARISQNAANTSANFLSITNGAPGVPGGGDKSFNVGVSHYF